MMAFPLLPTLTLAALWLGPGLAGWLLFRGQLTRKSTPVESAFFVLLGGLVFVSWPAFLLAEIGRFSLANLTILLLMGMAVAFLIRQGRGRLERPELRDLAQLVGIIALAAMIGAVYVWLIGPPSTYIIGGRDHGVYVNTGANIARTGSIIIEDQVLREAPPAARFMLVNPAVDTYQAGLPGPWSQGQRLAGFTIRSLDEGVITPHAFHLYPTWFAIFAAAGGLVTLLWPTMIFAVVGLWGAAATAGRLFGPRAALLTAALLAISLPQTWFARYPTAEILFQPLFWGGLLAALLWLQTGSRYAAFLAGAALGLTHLTKLDTVFIPVALLLFGIGGWLLGRRQAGSLAFWLSYGFLSLHAIVHAFGIATIYFIDHAVRVLLPDYLSRRLVSAASGRTDPAAILAALWRDNLGLIVIGVALLLIIIFCLVVIRRYLAGRETRSGRRIGLLLAVPLAAWLLWLAFNPTRGVGGEVLDQLGWYVTPLVLALALGGLLVLLARARSIGEAFALLLLLANSLPFFVLGAGTTADHFWAIRRFVPIVFPALFVLAAGLLDGGWLPWSMPRPIRIGASLVAGLFVTVLVWQPAAPFLRVVEFGGLDAELPAVTSDSRPGDVFLLELTLNAIEFGTPLWLIYDRPTFIIDPQRLGDPAISDAVFSWRAAGRRVFWLDQRGSFDVNFPGLKGVLVESVAFTGQRVEQVVDELPRELVDYAVVFNRYELVPDGESKAAGRVALEAQAGAQPD